MNNYSVHNYHLDLFLFHSETLHFLLIYQSLINEDIIVPDIPDEYCPDQFEDQINEPDYSTEIGSIS